MVTKKKYINIQNWRMPSGIILWYSENNRQYIENETESGHLEMEYRKCS